MNTKQRIYLTLAIIGLVSTWYHNISFMIIPENGVSAVAFIKACMSNHASLSVSWDIVIAAITGFIWMHYEAKRLDISRVWFFYFTGTFVAFAFAFPLFLFIREQKLKILNI
ncbi:MAG: DUF2834 domain-containing protein [Dokdonia sp.]|nr:DUF2834 domain-containing protein [Dokdonia sp.]